MDAEADVHENGATNGLAVRVSADEKRVEEARARLMVARNRTRNTLAVLRTEISTSIAEKTDWRTWYRARPGVFISAAFALGFLIARRR